MSKFNEKKIFEEADNWIKDNKKVSLATVVQTWGSSPLGIGSRMIVSEDGNFLLFFIQLSAVSNIFFSGKLIIFQIFF